MERDDKPGKRVWILGAGASKSHTRGVFPTLLELTSKAEQLGILKPDERHPEGRYPQLRKYVRRRFGATLGDPDEPLNLELVYTTLELDLLIRPDPELAASRAQVVRLLRHTIRTIQSRRFASAREYEWLTSQLSSNDSVITFNWDLLLDNAMGRREILKDRQGDPQPVPPRRGHYWNFVLQLTGWGEQTISQIAPPPPHTAGQWDGATGYYLKAHGSIDWYHCSNHLCRAFGRTYPVRDTRKQWYCGSCEEPLQLLLVPPTLNKAIRDLPVVRRVWNVAAKELGLAAEVIIWGYSLPPTDFYSDWLLRQARTTRCVRVSVINPGVCSDAAGGGLERAFVDRFRSVFRSSHDARTFAFYPDFSAFQRGTPLSIERG